MSGKAYSNLKNNRNKVMLTEVCGKVLNEENAYKSVKIALLSSNVIDADHQNSCFLQTKAICHHLYEF